MAEKKQRSTVGKWTRRTFLASAGLVGGGLALGVTLSPNRLKMTSDAAVSGDQILLNTWVKITPDNRITVIVPHSEMGQGAGTGLAQMLAEEMEADWSLVSIEQAPADDAHINSDLGRGYIVGEGASIPEFMYPMLDFAFLQVASGLVGQLTGGSTAIRLTGWHGMRRAGASAKDMMLQAAAQEWAVPVASLTAENSVIRHAPSGREATFGALAGRAAEFTPSLKPELKDPKTYKIVGKPQKRLDLPAKVTGEAQFGMDVVVPGMRYAAIHVAPIQNAKVGKLDASAALARPGVDEVVEIGDTVAVVADSYWTASQALSDLTVEWVGGDRSLSSAGIRATHEKDLVKGPFEAVIDEGDTGDLARATAETDGVIAADFDVPYLSHATMEPLNCTVWVRDGVCDVSAGVQNALFARRGAAEALGYDLEKVTLHPQLLGGGFGRRGRFDYVQRAVRLGEKIEGPVKVIWSREEDMADGKFRPAIVGKLRGRLDGDRMAAVSHRFIETRSMPDSERSWDFPYTVANKLVERVDCPSPVPIGSWRSVDHTQHGFFVEAFVNEMAEAAGVDPLQFRIDHLSDPRWIAVMERLRDEAGWTGKPLGGGRAQGVALVKSFDTIVGQVVEASVTGDGGVKVHKVTSVVDAGLIVNPNAGEAQIESSVIYALTSALFGEISVEGGRIQQKNFPDYDMIRLANAPAQKVVFIKSDNPPGGLGEPGTPPATPALANAIYRASGKRVRSMPLARSGLYPA